MKRCEECSVQSLVPSKPGHHLLGFASVFSAVCVLPCFYFFPWEEEKGSVSVPFLKESCYRAQTGFQFLIFVSPPDAWITGVCYHTRPKYIFLKKIDDSRKRGWQKCCKTKGEKSWEQQEYLWSIVGRTSEVDSNISFSESVGGNLSSVYISYSWVAFIPTPPLQDNMYFKKQFDR